MKAYFSAFVNWESNNWAPLLPIAKFAYNNSMNASTGHIAFELNCGYHVHVFFEDKYNAHSKSSSAKGLAMKLRELINVCLQNLLYAQDL